MELHVLPYGRVVSKLYTPNGDLDIALEGCVRSGCVGLGDGIFRSRLYMPSELCNALEACMCNGCAYLRHVYGRCAANIACASRKNGVAV